MEIEDECSVVVDANLACWSSRWRWTWLWSWGGTEEDLLDVSCKHAAVEVDAKSPLTEFETDVCVNLSFVGLVDLLSKRVPVASRGKICPLLVELLHLGGDSVARGHRSTI